MKKIILILLLSILFISCDFSTEPSSSDRIIFQFHVNTDNINVTIQNILGDKIIKLEAIPNEYPFTYIWDGKNENGEYVEDGFYIAYIVIASDYEETKMIYFSR